MDWLATALTLNGRVGRPKLPKTRKNAMQNERMPLPLPLRAQSEANTNGRPIIVSDKDMLYAGVSVLDYFRRCDRGRR